jgi:predicted nicotinamide N-methyase
VLVADQGRAELPDDRREPLIRYSVATSMEPEDREMRETATGRIHA